MSDTRRDLAKRAHSPSTWARRGPVLILALVGVCLATYLALHQAGVIPQIWDPFFGPASSDRVLTSSIARLLPIPDAALGAIAYLVEAILTAIGDERRWQATPHLVIAYGIVVAALAVMGIGLVLTQAFVVRSWCMLCLLSALISFVNAVLAWDEVHASLGVLGWWGGAPRPVAPAGRPAPRGHH